MKEKSDESYFKLSPENIQRLDSREGEKEYSRFQPTSKWLVSRRGRTFSRQSCADDYLDFPESLRSPSPSPFSLLKVPIAVTTLHVLLVLKLFFWWNQEKPGGGLSLFLEITKTETSLSVWVLGRPFKLANFYWRWSTHVSGCSIYTVFAPIRWICAVLSFLSIGPYIYLLTLKKKWFLLVVLVSSIIDEGWLK